MEDFKSYFENAGVCLILLDQNAMIRNVNNYFETFTEFSKEDVIDKLMLYDLVRSDKKSELKRILTSGSWKQESPFQFSCHMLTRKRHSHPVLLTFTSMPGSEDVLVTATNIAAILKEETDRHRAELQKEIELIASGLGHEIRNHLSAINTSIEVLRDSMLVTGEDEELMNIVLEENKALNNVTREFAFFARLEDPSITLIDINQLLHEVIEFEQQNAPMGISFRTNFLQPPPQFYADPAQLKTVFFNIIENSIEAMPDGGTIEISLSRNRTELDEDVLIFTIADTGEGIADEDLKNVFKPFFSTKENHIGMGLPVSKRLVHKHKGDIFIESQAGKGTKVIIQIPFLQKELIQTNLPGLL